MKITLKQEHILPKEAENIRVTVVDRKVEIEFNIKEEQNEEVKVDDISSSNEYLDEYFPIAKASTLSLEDKFLKHRAQTDNQKRFKKMLKEAIKSGLPDFRAPRMDASFDEEGNICYKAGMKPAVGKSANWWNEKAKKFMPEKESRLGTTKERIAFLGLLIKYLIEEKGYTVTNAWKAVCDQSKELGHYGDSEDAKHEFEPTGSRQIGEWYDLANTYKITVDDEAGGFSLVGGDYYDDGNCFPLADVGTIFNPDGGYDLSTGWLVLSV